MRSCWWLAVCFVVIGCGKFTPNAKPWPATIASFNNFTPDQQTRFKSFVSDLNTRSGHDVFLLDANSGNYPITVTVVAPPTASPNRAGYSIRNDEKCDVQISNFLFDADKVDYQESVLIHELGHCSGLGHTTKLGDVMYPTTAKFASYTPVELTSFVQSLMSAISGH